MRWNDFPGANQNLIIGEDSISRLTAFLKEKNYSKCFVLMDENTEEHCFPFIETSLTTIQLKAIPLTVKAGESSKDLETCKIIWEELALNYADRKSVLINLGGGVVCDLGGFIASLYKRGIDFINVPSSLLAMVDAAIGGKCGIDFDHFKNQLGVFNLATLTVVYPQFLTSLPVLEWQSGMAEVYKHALIEDKAYWTKLKELDNPDRTALTELIKQSIFIKANIVANDPKEEGVRKSLNFGHTVGHAIESYFLKVGDAIPHGFAVAAGMIIEAWLSVKKTALPSSELQEIEFTLDQQYDRLIFSKDIFDEILYYLSQDKKNVGRKSKYTLLKAIGNCVVDVEVEEELVLSALTYYQEKTKDVSNSEA